MGTEKWKRVAATLMRRRLTRFQAATECRDWVLPSTVAYLQRRGIRVERERVVVPGFGGAPTSCCRYWIAPDQHHRVRALLDS